MLDTAVEKDEHHRFFPTEVSKQELEDAVKQYTIRNEELKKLTRRASRSITPVSVVRTERRWRSCSERASSRFWCRR